MVQPPSGSVIASGPFSVEVDAEDGTGNIDALYNGPVTIALASEPGSGTLLGTLTTTAVAGVAEFDDLTIDDPGDGYTITASTTGLTAGTSPAFDVTDELVVTTQPPDYVQVGGGFGLSVTVEDADGNVDTSYTGSLTATLYDNDGPDGHAGRYRDGAGG